MARRIGDPTTLASTLFSRHIAWWDPANAEERLATATEVVQLVTTNRELALQGYRWRMPDLLEWGDAAAAWQDLDGHAQLAQSLSQPFYLWDAKRWQAMRALLQGRFDVGEQLAHQAQRRTCAEWHVAALPLLAPVRCAQRAGTIGRTRDSCR